MKLSVVIPAYLEEENLRLLLPRLNHVCKSLRCRYEILVIDTETALDSTENACREHGAVWLQRAGGNLYGDAIRSGIRAAQGQYILFMDADGSHTPEFIPKLYEHREDYDIVIASRYISGGHTENPRLLILLSHILNMVYRIVLGLKCNDVSNSFKLYDASQLKAVSLNCPNFDIVEEILVKMSRNNRDLKIKEVPFTFKKRMFGQTKRNLPAFVVTYVFTLIRLRFGK